MVNKHRYVTNPIEKNGVVIKGNEEMIDGNLCAMCVYIWKNGKGQSVELQLRTVRKDGKYDRPVSGI